jgi:hypothetical protein
MEPINIISFSLQPLNVAREICDIFEKNQIKAYTYHFSTNTAETIKWGLSNDNEWKTRSDGGTKTWGNRVYKQALGLKGWPNRNYNGDSSAIEFSNLMEDYYSSLTKNDIVLTVYDMGSTEFMKLPTTEQRLILELKESEFLKMYKERHGQLPYGNVECIKKRGHLKTYIGLFEIDIN